MELLTEMSESLQRGDTSRAAEPARQAIDAAGAVALAKSFVGAA